MCYRYGSVRFNVVCIVVQSSSCKKNSVMGAFGKPSAPEFGAFEQEAQKLFLFSCFCTSTDPRVVFYTPVSYGKPFHLRPGKVLTQLCTGVGIVLRLDRPRYGIDFGPKMVSKIEPQNAQH